MRKWFLLLTCFFIVNESIAVHVDSDPNDLLFVRIATTVPAKKIPRSAMPVVQAWLDTGFNQLEVDFNYEVGNVTVTVETMGRVVASASCDTAMQDFLYLTVPSEPGLYTVRIVADDYEGEGDYTLDSF